MQPIIDPWEKEKKEVKDLYYNNDSQYKWYS